MSIVKQIQIKPITSKYARQIITKYHYSKKFVNNSQLHFGVFLNDRCEGAMSFGPSLDKRKIQGLVRDTKWNDFIELNRMAFSDILPRNSESRCLGIAFRIIKKNYPHIKWIISFADGTQCGDGTIYRAAGFVLTGIKKNNQIWKMPNNEIVTRITLTDTRCNQREKIINRVSQSKGRNIPKTGGASMKYFVEAGAEPLDGYQLRYIYFIDKSYRNKLTVPEIPFSKIDEIGAGMYKGQKR